MGTTVEYFTTDSTYTFFFHFNAPVVVIIQWKFHQFQSVEKCSLHKPQQVLFINIKCCCTLQCKPPIVKQTLLDTTILQEITNIIQFEWAQCDAINHTLIQYALYRVSADYLFRFRTQQHTVHNAIIHKLV